MRLVVTKNAYRLNRIKFTLKKGGFTYELVLETNINLAWTSYWFLSYLTQWYQNFLQFSYNISYPELYRQPCKKLLQTKKSRVTESCPHWRATSLLRPVSVMNFSSLNCRVAAVSKLTAYFSVSRRGGGGEVMYRGNLYLFIALPVMAKVWKSSVWCFLWAAPCLLRHFPTRFVGSTVVGN